MTRGYPPDRGYGAPPSDVELIHHFCWLVDEHDRMCETVPTTLLSFELNPSKPIPDVERWHRIIRAMSLRKFLIGSDCVRTDRVLAALERTLTVDDLEVMDHRRWRQQFGSIGKWLDVREGGSHDTPPVDVFEDVIYGQVLHGDFERWRRTQARSRMTVDLAIWELSESVEYFVRRLRTAIKLAIREGRIPPRPRDL